MAKRVASTLVALLILVLAAGCSQRYVFVKPYVIDRAYLSGVVPSSVVVGDYNVRFYVSRISDERLEKAVFAGSHKIYYADFKKTIELATERALKDTGWGVAYSPATADYDLEVIVKRMDLENNFMFFKYTVKASVFVVDASSGNIIDTINVDREHPFYAFSTGLMSTEDSAIAAMPVKMYYDALVKAFSSADFYNLAEKKFVRSK